MQEMQNKSTFNNKALIDEFYSRVQHFLKIACLQIKQKYNFGDPVMPAIKLMDPKTALSIQTRDEYSSLFNLINLLPRISY